MTKIDPSNPPKRIECNVVGVTHRQPILKSLPQKTRAALLREPDNEHDSNAIGVYESGRLVGYVPKDEAAWIASVMDAGEWTYACPYMRVGYWEERGIYTASIILERRRPAADVIGSEHLPKSTASKRHLADAIPLREVSNRPSMANVAGNGLGSLVAATARAIPKSAMAIWSATNSAIKKIDELIVRVCGDDVFMHYFVWVVGVVVLVLSLVVVVSWPL